MGLDYKPESIDALRARYHRALARVYPLRFLFDGEDRPGLLRDHIFDFDDGVRLIVSRHVDDGPERTELIHVSASKHRRDAKGKPIPIDPATAAAQEPQDVWELVDHFLALSDRRGHEIEPIAITGNGRVAHFAVKVTGSEGGGLNVH